MKRGTVNFSKAKRDAFAQIDSSRDDLIAFLAAYIRHKSINPERALDIEAGETSSCQHWLRGSLQSLACFESVEEWEAAPGEFNVAAIMPSINPEFGTSVLFNGHSDVVPVTASEYDRWLGGDPWSGHVHGGAVYGRGACDMKGPNVAMIWAASALAHIGFVPNGRATFTFTVGEESGRAEVGPLDLLSRGYNADIAVIGEPTGLKVCPAAVGWFFFRVDVAGKASHASSRGSSIYPSHQRPSGVNAIEELMQIAQRLQGLEHQWGLYEQHALMEPGTMAMNPVQFSGGGPQATTPDACHAVWAVVVSPNRRCADVQDEIIQVIESEVTWNHWLRDHPAKVTTPYLQGFFEPVNVPSHHPACKMLLQAVEGVANVHPQLGCMPTPSDANFFFEAGQPAIICGPGNLLRNGVHGLDEHIEIDSLISAAKVYASFIIDWCSAPLSVKGLERM